MSENLTILNCQGFQGIENLQEIFVVWNLLILLCRVIMEFRTSLC